MYPDLHTDLDNLDSVENNLRHSAKGSLDAYDVTHSLTDGGEEGGKEASRRQDDDGDEKQVGWGKVVRPQYEEDVWKGDEDEKKWKWVKVVTTVENE